jgi:hypothetical protein
MRTHTSVPLPLRRRHHLLTAAVLVALVTTACGRSDDTTVDELPVGQAIEVAGREVLVKWDLSPSGTLVFVPGSAADLDAAVAADEAAIERAVVAVTAFLDRILTERNLGSTTTIAASSIDATAFATAMGLDGVQSDDVPDLQISSASYVIEIGSLGTPGWAQARVESTLVDLTDQGQPPTRRLDTFLFTFDAAGELELVAVEVAP